MSVLKTVWDYLVLWYGGLEFAAYMLFGLLFLYPRDLIALHFPKRKSFRGDVVLITGGASGIGRLLALKFAEIENITVVVWDLNEEALQATEREIAARGAAARSYRVDVTNREQVYATAERMRQEIGKDVTVLVNNAGIVTGQRFFEGDDRHSERVMQVNAVSHFWTTKAFMPSMMKDNYGHLITIASTAGLVGVGGLSDYCCSKAAAVSFHESLRVEMRDLGKSGVDTLLVNPFFINTGMFQGVHTKAPYLLPILEPDYVADSIFQAAMERRQLLNLPFATYLLFIAWALPASARDLMYNYLGIGESMRGFKQTRKMHVQ